MNGEAGRVTQNPAEIDGVLFGEFVFGDFPRLELRVDVAVEIQLSFFDELEGRQRGHRLADRAGLKQGLGRDGRLGVDVSQAVAFGPFDFAMIDDRHAYAGNVQPLHPLGKLIGRAALDADHRNQTAFNGGDSLLNLGAGHSTRLGRPPFD